MRHLKLRRHIARHLVMPTLHVLSLLFRMPIGVRGCLHGDSPNYDGNWKWKLLTWIAWQECFLVDSLCRPDTTWRHWYTYPVIRQNACPLSWWQHIPGWSSTRQQNLPAWVPAGHDTRPKMFP